MSIRVFVIGDPHFKAKYIQEGDTFINRCIEQARRCDPDLVIVLGDILDTHEIVNVYAHDMAYRFINGLSEIAKTCILIGNHDMANPTVFLTKMHIFNPFKKWKNVIVVDTPIMITQNDIGLKDDTESELDEFEEERAEISFVLVPYTAPGRFQDALDMVPNWKSASCIFAHQEFQGCKMGPMISVDGDCWSEDYPMVISGHIHDEQVIDNVYYIGSSIQHSFSESYNKYIWLATFYSGESIPNIDKIDLNMEKKKIITMDIKDVSSFDIKRTENSIIKLSLKGNNEEFKQFRKSKLYTKLRSCRVRFAYRPTPKEDTGTREVKRMDFIEALNKVVKSKGDNVVKEYETLFGAMKSTVEDVANKDNDNHADSESVSEKEYDPEKDAMIETDEEYGSEYATDDEECYGTDVE